LAALEFTRFAHVRFGGSLGIKGLGVFTITMFNKRFLAMIREMWLVTAVGLGVGLGWLANFNLWRPGTRRCEQDGLE
jgi:hypothetical protein